MCYFALDVLRLLYSNKSESKVSRKLHHRIFRFFYSPQFGFMTLTYWFWINIFVLPSIDWYIFEDCRWTGRQSRAYQLQVQVLIIVCTGLRLVIKLYSLVLRSFRSQELADTLSVDCCSSVKHLHHSHFIFWLIHVLWYWGTQTLYETFFFY